MICNIVGVRQSNLYFNSIDLKSFRSTECFSKIFSRAVVSRDTSRSRDTILGYENLKYEFTICKLLK